MNIVTSGYGEILEVDGVKRFKKFSCSKKVALLMIRSKFRNSADFCDEITEREIVLFNNGISETIKFHIRAELPDAIEHKNHKYSNFKIPNKMSYEGLKEGKDNVKLYYKIGEWYMEAVVCKC